MFCPKCGIKREGGSAFCADCGNQFPDTSSTIRTKSLNTLHGQTRNNPNYNTSSASNRVSGTATRHTVRKKKRLNKKALAITIFALLGIILVSIFITQTIAVRPLSEKEIIEIASGKIERGMAITDVSIDRRETDGREDIVFAVVTMEDGNIRRTADYELVLNYFDEDGWMLVKAIHHQKLMVIPLTPPPDEVVFNAVSSSYSEYTVSLVFESTNEFHTGYVVHTYNVKREWPLFTYEGSVTVVSDFSEITESWDTFIINENILGNWNLSGNWTASWEQPTFAGGNDAHLDMTVIEVNDTYIHARGKIWSTTDRTDWLAPPTFEMTFDERLIRLRSQQTAVFFNENAGVWSYGDSDNSYLITLPLVPSGRSEGGTLTFNISFWRNDASVSQRGFEPSYTLTKTGN